MKQPSAASAPLLVWRPSVVGVMAYAVACVMVTLYVMCTFSGAYFDPLLHSPRLFGLSAMTLGSVTNTGWLGVLLFDWIHAWREPSFQRRTAVVSVAFATLVIVAIQLLIWSMVATGDAYEPVPYTPGEEGVQELDPEWERRHTAERYPVGAPFEDASGR